MTLFGFVASLCRRPVTSDGIFFRVRKFELVGGCGDGGDKMMVCDGVSGKCENQKSIVLFLVQC